MDLINFLSEIPDHLIEEILLEITPDEYMKFLQFSPYANTSPKFMIKYESRHLQTKTETNQFRHIITTSYLGSMKHGYEKTYFKSRHGPDQLHMVVPYRFGKKHGEERVYGKNSIDRMKKGLPGSIKSISHWINGKKEGDQFYFHDPNREQIEKGLSGSIHYISPYKNGKLNGYSESYYPSNDEKGPEKGPEKGLLHKRSLWKNGKQIGPEEIYDQISS